MTLLIKRIRNLSFHFLLIIIFFLTNGYSEYVGLIPFQDIILFFILMASGGIVLFFLFSYFFRNRLKGGLFTSVLAGVWLFYGVLQDTLMSTRLFHNLSAHRFLVPIILTALIFLFIWLKKSNKGFQRTTLYVNSLLSIFIVFDLAKISWRFIQKQEKTANAHTVSPEIIDCDDCTKPDIYFVVLDEYSGSRVLKEYFEYDNSSFENFLRINRFFVPANPSSNYSNTPFSIASTFDMKYITWHKQRNELQAYAQAAKSIPVSSSITLLESLGYSFLNYSVFDLADQPSVFQTGFLPLKLKLITAKTLPERIKRDFFWRVEVRNKGTGMLKWITRSIHQGNERMISLTMNHSKHGKTQASFVYTHLMMPHAPYVFDSTGTRTFINYTDASVPEEIKKAGYLQYLVYTNKRVRDLVETILKNTNRKAVIVLLSDHGYRDRVVHNGCKDINNIFSAVFLPDGNYANYYDSISNVNQFRALFNTIFSQQFQKLNDSCLLE